MAKEYRKKLENTRFLFDNLFPFLYYGNDLVRSHSGLVPRFAKPLYGLNRIEGSNPSLTAENIFYRETARAETVVISRLAGKNIYNTFMAINWIPLDNSHEKDSATVLVGKDILIMFKPTNPVPTETDTISQLINTPDLLLKTEILEKVRNLQLLTDKIVETVSTMLRIRDAKIPNNILRNFLAQQKKEIIDTANQIARTEDELQLYFAGDHRIYFCSECDAYIGLATDPIPEKCKVCSKPIVKDITKADSIRYLDGLIRNYLQGIWLQDYIAKILNSMDWETWTECSVMGSSGVYHPIDILAINKTHGKVAIIECKRSADGDHAFKLAARFSDIQPSFGLLMSLKKLNSEPGKNLLAKRPGLKLVELEGHSDESIKEKLRGYISRDN